MSVENVAGPDGVAARPFLQIVRGEPTADEVAALVAVLSARAATSGPAPAPTPSAWSDRAAGMRTALPVGTGAWRTPGRGTSVRTRADW